MMIDFVNMSACEGATIVAAIFNKTSGNLFSIFLQQVESNVFTRSFLHFSMAFARDRLRTYLFEGFKLPHFDRASAIAVMMSLICHKNKGMITNPKVNNPKV